MPTYFIAQIKGENPRLGVWRQMSHVHHPIVESEIEEVTASKVDVAVKDYCARQGLTGRPRIKESGSAWIVHFN